MRGTVSTFRFFAVLLLFAAGNSLHAQSAGTKFTGEVPRSLSFFGAYSHVDTDYGQVGAGYTFGGDYSFNKRFATPSIEARYTHGGTSAVSEGNFAGGIKIEKGYHHFHPYLNALVGYGTIQFANVPGYTHDNSITYDLGAGLDYDVTRSFAAKFDAQQQYWKLGTGSSELEPYNLSVGIVYRVPFGFHK